jgi:hypothetical protein
VSRAEFAFLLLLSCPRRSSCFLNQNSVSDLRAVENHSMANSNIIAHDRWHSTWRCMQDGVVLDICSLADPYGELVASENGLEPHTGVFAKFDSADHIGRWRHETG